MWRICWIIYFRSSVSESDSIRFYYIRNTNHFMNLQTIQTKIYEIRGHKVMLDFDLALLYEVEIRILNQSVKRNIDRFPKDFMFKLTKEEWNQMSSQIVMTSFSTRAKSVVKPRCENMRSQIVTT